MAADCPVCLSVAAGGRIRLTDEGAAVVEVLLRSALSETLKNRRIAINAGADASVHRERAKLLQRTLEEIERTQIQMGWLGGEPQRANP